MELSNFNIRLPDRKMPKLCNVNSNDLRPFVSDGSFFRVTFKSNEFYDGIGFDAFYQFQQKQGQLLQLPDSRFRRQAILGYTARLLESWENCGLVETAGARQCFLLRRWRKGTGRGVLREISRKSALRKFVRLQSLQ